MHSSPAFRAKIALLMAVFGALLAPTDGHGAHRLRSPRLAFQSREPGKVTLTVMNRSPRGSRIEVQRKLPHPEFEPITTYRVQSSTATVIDPVDSGDPVIYRARAARKGKRSSWGPVLRVPRLSNSSLKPPSESPSCGGCPSEMSSAVVDATNRIRLANGLEPLDWNADLACAAQDHVRRMMTLGTLTHEGWWEEIQARGYQGGKAGQNVARGASDGDSIVSLWSGSTLHRENLLRSSWSVIGVGCKVTSTGEIWWAQNFGG